MTWRLAAVWAHYTQEKFFSLPGDEQSAVVAAYLTEKQIDSILSEAGSKKTLN